VYALIREHIPFIESDRTLYEFMETMRKLVSAGEIVNRVA
jgi:histidine ammonia-lyase